ncbi:hypothetical protein Hanom_Chr08g00729591 [Helianthus anomalus]
MNVNSFTDFTSRFCIIHLFGRMIEIKGKRTHINREGEDFNKSEQIVQISTMCVLCQIER